MRAFTAMLCSVATAAAIALVSFPADAQAPPPTAKKKTTQVVGRPATRVEVRRRSFLDPGTETKTHQEPYLNYAFPPGERLNQIGADPNDFKLNWTRMPFPSCLDLAGFCNR